MMNYLADKIILFEGKPSVYGIASDPLDCKTGIDKFLKSIDITFRHDPDNNRPRVNKKGSIKDNDQKKSGIYF